jgi:cytochrome c
MGDPMKQIRTWTVCLTLTVGPVAAVAADKGDAAKGKESFTQLCSVCHNADSDEKKMGPGLKGLFKKDKMATGKKPTEPNVRAQIDDGGNGMPGYKDQLSDAEKDNLIAYLKTL